MSIGLERVMIRAKTTGTELLALNLVTRHFAEQEEGFLYIDIVFNELNAFGRCAIFKRKVYGR
jgi:hypothetical protein